jgi:hypothetical protein
MLTDLDRGVHNHVRLVIRLASGLSSVLPLSLPMDPIGFDQRHQANESSCTKVTDMARVARMMASLDPTVEVPTHPSLSLVGALKRRPIMFTIKAARQHLVSVRLDVVIL